MLAVAAGGSEGATGENRIDDEPVPAKTGRALDAGSVVTVVTPGGGGWGVSGA